MIQHLLSRLPLGHESVASCSLEKALESASFRIRLELCLLTSEAGAHCWRIRKKRDERLRVLKCIIEVLELQMQRAALAEELGRVSASRARDSLARYPSTRASQPASASSIQHSAPRVDQTSKLRRCSDVGLETKCSSYSDLELHQRFRTFTSSTSLPGRAPESS